MSSPKKPTFEFHNQISPYYIEPLFLQIQEGKRYSNTDLRKILWDNGLAVEGGSIIRNNINAWSLIGLTQNHVTKDGNKQIRESVLTSLGKQIIDTYGTNQALFYDVIHFLFYSAWPRSSDLLRTRFWLYQRVCDTLWHEAPSQTDVKMLTIRLQGESHQAFSKYKPSFPSRSVNAVFPWLGALQPAFLAPSGTRSQLVSTRRSHCTPQLFHLAVDLLYTTNDLLYGTPLAVGDEHIQAICRTCLLDTERFWSMAELTQMSIRGFEIKRGQWATSITLAGPPNWISLPDFSDSTDDSGLDGEEEEDDGEDEQ